FADTPLISERGALHVFAPGDEARARKIAEDFGRDIAGVRLLGRNELLDRVPVLRPERVAGAVSDPECRDMDVAAIHQGFLRRARAAGARLLTDARVSWLARSGDRWRIRLADGREIAARAVVNAAGAWVDEVARMAELAPLGFQPLRRTIIVFRPAHATVDSGWPLVIDIDESFYFKPETGRILASPADETPSPPCDAQPDVIDIATIVDRLERWTVFDVPRIENRWAGLRTFAPDRVPVVGEDPRSAGFFWCAGQGGYGIQTAPAMGRLTAAVVLGRDLPSDLSAAGVDPARYAPARLLKKG
ncbi:MAG: FAD-binding oxidoreductase, partial [Alphaproteobacteria bacterium]